MQEELQFLQHYINPALNIEAGSGSRLREYLSWDWDILLRVAVKHGVMPLLYVRLKTLSPQINAPEQFNARLKLAFQKNISRSLRLTKELFALTDQLKKANLRVIPFKGPIAAFQSYGDVTLRQSGDIDLLVQKENLSNIEAVLQKQGYLRQPSYTVAQEKRFLQVDCQHVFYSCKKNMTIDLHWEFAPAYWGIRLNTDELWSRTQPALIEDAWLDILAPEDTVLVLVLSTAKDLFNRLIKLSDLAAFIACHPHLDWAAIAERAEAHGLSLMLEVSLTLINELWYIPLPPIVAARAAGNQYIQPLTRQAHQWLLQQTPAQGLQSVLLPAKLLDSRVAQWKFYLRLGLTPTLEDWQAVDLPERLGFAYYLLRPLRLAGKYLLNKNKS